MKRTAILLIALVACQMTNGQFKTTFKSDNDTTSEAQIKRLEYTLTELLTKGDIQTYSGYLTEDYIRIAANGEISTKAQVLQSFSKMPPGANNSQMYPHDLKVSVYGNTAIMHGILDIETKTGDITTKRTSLITKVFIKRDDKWYMATMQGTTVK
jgi:ketosteroid isomerase-like protein